MRFTVWSERDPGNTRIEAAVSLDEAEAARVARSLAHAEPAPTEQF